MDSDFYDGTDELPRPVENCGFVEVDGLCAHPLAHGPDCDTGVLCPLKEETIYEDDNGDLYRVSSGLTSGTSWMTVRIKRQGNGNQHRVKSKNLPLRETREEAQRDLDGWAMDKSLRVVGTVGLMVTAGGADAAG